MNGRGYNPGYFPGERVAENVAHKDRFAPLFKEVAIAIIEPCPSGLGRTDGSALQIQEEHLLAIGKSFGPLRKARLQLRRRLRDGRG